LPDASVFSGAHATLYISAASITLTGWIWLDLLVPPPRAALLTPPPLVPLTPLSHSSTTPQNTPRPQRTRRHSLSLNYGEKPVNDHEEFCDAKVNAPCVTRDHSGGCSLWYNVGYNCDTNPQKQPNCNAGYVYSGDNSGDHVILVPTTPTRGLEDLTDAAKSQGVIAKTQHLWTAFWTDSVNKKSGTSGLTGFESKTTGALVINNPFYRE